MTVLRIVPAIAMLIAAPFAATPASAQFFFTPHDFRAGPVRGDELGLAQPLPGATDAERRAGLVWNLRSALNVGALACDFEPTLLTVSNYNTMLVNHKDELKKSFDTLNKYFIRVNKSAAAGQTAFDNFSTRTYSSFTPVAAQYGFCQTAGAIGRAVIYAKRGTLGDVAAEHMQEFRNSMTPWGEQRFPHKIAFDGSVTLPRLDDACWKKKGDWNDKACGPLNWLARG